MVRHTLIGAIAANRPLLTSIVFAFGLPALAVMGLLRAVHSTTLSAQGMLVSDFALHGLLIAVLPLVLASFSPRGTLGRVGFGAIGAMVFYGGIAALSTMLSSSAHWPFTAQSGLLAALVFSFFVAVKPIMGGVGRLAITVPMAAILGAFGAAGLMTLSGSGTSDHLGALTVLSFVLAVAIGVSVAADFARRFAVGDSVHEAAGVAAHLSTAPSVFAVLCTIGAFMALMFENRFSADIDWGVALNLAGGVVLAVAAVLLFTASALSLSATDEKVAVEENHRRQAFRRYWRPLRAALPARSAIAVTAILLILSITAYVEMPHGVSFAALTMVTICAIASAVVFVSLRTGLYIFFSLITSLTVLTYLYGLSGTETSAVVRYAVLAASAVLYSQLALSWRDSRRPSRKPHEAAEQAMIDGVCRYLAGGAMMLAGLVCGAVTGLWTEAAQAAWLLGWFFIAGLVIAAPVMIALSALMGRD